MKLLDDIISANGIKTEFSAEVSAQAARAARAVTGRDIEGREDFRGQPCITIDGISAKDLDDAVFLETAEAGYRLYVHIADVAHYVKEGTALDKEAYARGTSCYPGDSCVPMLPANLSNGICSLNAGEDRLCITCCIKLDAGGNVISGRFYESVINVSRRMTYDEVMGILESGADVPMIKDMLALSEKLREKRRERGAIFLETSESGFVADEEGMPIEVFKAGSNMATSIIEEFMIAANECAARTMKKAGYPFLYRVHDESDPLKVMKLFALAKTLKIFSSTTKSAKGAKKARTRDSKDIQKLLNKAKGTRYYDIINRAALSCMQQAVYSNRNSGHYGLASACYCHFTSPIRRYPDLFCHRMLKLFINKIGYAQKPGLFKDAIHLSAMERRAVTAEREVADALKVLYMKDKIGRVFTGNISGIQKWGMYVELPDSVEGLVSFGDMQDDYYVADAENFRVYGERRGRVYRLGDRVKVALVDVDLEKRHINFVLVKI